ncbi:bifunctional enoyl-CoA hydratase/phosphate acetyltransferase [Occallatibacter riparius]|uniref:Bifunctional enoyl-CoA hydratase/phosphate acetyltransferase n=1 Tax=Occallatibacter riparius TaxID=1002689 RepID=A0A9J7BL81_9BACT|nr:bifunctional enoyl-CoA hydratase/phosphate acetyltransferase [Occallatibacter riparius]UWZ81646.1 bifunctional enoyl-CoA hydratase/phosphate acetyltransferase [Occallatibacter riparius]
MSDLAPLAEAVAVDPLVGHPADYHVFHNFLERCKELPAITTAVVWPLSSVALRGAIEAAEEGLIEPTLIGDEAEMKALADEIGVDISNYPILQADTESRAAELGCIMCRSGNAQAIMKGSLHTDELMRAAMNKDTGLRTNRRISHVFVMDTPAYDRTLLISDAAINITPELEDKVHIIQNAIDLAHALGIPEPKVALLSAVETVNPKIKSTLDAAALCKMADRGQITGGILDGPLAFDTAVSARAAEIKKLESPVVGQADILVVPDLESGNMLAKQLEYLGGAQMAGVVLGARVPAILTSRADSAETRLTSCAVAVLMHYATHPVIKV